jgi:hypothetical protein
MKKAVFTNKALNETYTLGGVKDLAKAWSLVTFACERNNWNHIDVTVKLITL